MSPPARSNKSTLLLLPFSYCPKSPKVSCRGVRPRSSRIFGSTPLLNKYLVITELLVVCKKWAALGRPLLFISIPCLTNNFSMGILFAQKRRGW